MTTAMLERQMAVEAFEVDRGPVETHPWPSRPRPVPDPIQLAVKPPTEPRG